MDYYSLLIKATRLKPGLSICYAEDLRWLVWLRLAAHLSDLGLSVERSHPSALRVRKRDVETLQKGVFSYACAGADCIQNIDSGFCLNYGYDGYSLAAINYRHRRSKERVGYGSYATPSEFIGSNQLNLGNFAFILKQTPQSLIHPMPSDLNCCGIAEAPLGKARSVYIYLGASFNTERMSDDARRLVEELTPDPRGWWDEYKGVTRFCGATKFMRYYGHLGSDEDELRLKLGFAEKGKAGVSEEILYRSSCEIFGANNVFRRYRGVELQRLELDVWVPSEKIAFEYQGEQHFKHVKHWHGTTGFQKQRERDAKKIKLCRTLGYRLMHFKPNDNLRKGSILKRLREKGWVSPVFEH